MKVLALLLLLDTFMASAQAVSHNDGDLLEQAQHAYRLGLAARSDAVSARPQFSAAAEIYDRLWQRGMRSRQLAAQRGRAHLLAGQLGHAVAAYREGLLLFPDDSNLVDELQFARAQVAYPENGSLDMARQPESWPRVRALSRDGLTWWALGFYAAGCLLLARAWMKRSLMRTWLGCCLLGIAVVAVVAIQWVGSMARDAAVVIGEQASPLYYGNGEHYPLRVERLPPGLEAHILTRRGEWLQIQLHGGTVGWIPASAALIVEKH